MLYDNGIFLLVEYCIFTIQPFFFNLFAMLLSSITFTQHHNLLLRFAICKYIVYTITKEWNMHIATIFAMRAPSNAKQHHLLSQRPTLGSTSSAVRTMYSLNTKVPFAMPMEVGMSLRPWCSSILPYYILCILGLLCRAPKTPWAQGGPRSDTRDLWRRWCEGPSDPSVGEGPGR